MIHWRHWRLPCSRGCAVTTADNVMKYLFALATMIGVVGCSRAADLPVRKATNLDEAAVRLSQLTKRPIRPFATRDLGREQNFDARSVIVPTDRASVVVDAMRREVGPGLIVFIGHAPPLPDPAVGGSEVVVATGQDQFDILRVAKSDAANYDMETEDLVRRLQTYDGKYGIDIFHAETDTIEFKLKSMPQDLSAFCKDLYEFCPDIVEQGSRTITALELEILKHHSVYLWWD